MGQKKNRTSLNWDSDFKEAFLEHDYARAKRVWQKASQPKNIGKTSLISFAETCLAHSSVIHKIQPSSEFPYNEIQNLQYNFDDLSRKILTSPKLEENDISTLWLDVWQYSVKPLYKLHFLANPNFPSSILAKEIAKDWDYYDKEWISHLICITILRNPNCPPEILEKAVYETQYSNYDMLKAVVSNPNLPVSLQPVLVKKPRAALRVALARRKDLTEETVGILSQDPRSSVLGALLSSGYAVDQEVVEKAATHGGTLARLGAAKNGEGKHVDNLTTDESRLVAKTAMRNQKVSIEAKVLGALSGNRA